MNLKALRLPQMVYLFLLVYVLAALLFWGFSLYRQSRIIYEAEVRALPLQIDPVKEPARFQQRLDELSQKQAIRKKQYLGEGATFLVVILIGAAVVYSAFQRSLRLSRQQNNFMLAVTHELKTPLAAVKLNLQTLQMRRLSAEQQAQLIGHCVLEANRLNDLCNNLLITSQLEEQQYKKTREYLNLSELVEESLHDYRGRYAGRFVADTAPEIYVWGDRLLLQMALNNLLENAVKYSPAADPIRVSLTQESTHILIRVADSGPGIADGDKKRIFQKFYRLGNEETRLTKGTGLGLYLTQKIIQQQKGTITVKDHLPQGSVFEIQLPVA